MNYHRLSKVDLVSLVEMLFETDDLQAQYEPLSENSGADKEDNEKYGELWDKIKIIRDKLNDEFIGLSKDADGSMTLDNHEYFIEAPTVEDIRKVIKHVEDGNYYYGSDISDGFRKIFLNDDIDETDMPEYRIIWMKD